jgi:hypothetical protein
MMKTALSVFSLFLVLIAAPAGLSAADPVPAPRPIYFSSGAKSGTVGGHVQRGEFNLYSLVGDAGQFMTVSMTTPGGNAVFQIYEPDTAIGRDGAGQLTFTGKALRSGGPGEDATRWTGRLPRKGTYIIAIGSTRGNANYSMDVKIE